MVVRAGESSHGCSASRLGRDDRRRARARMVTRVEFGRKVREGWKGRDGVRRY
jgi:hypothetical protein